MARRSRKRRPSVASVALVAGAASLAAWQATAPPGAVAEAPGVEAASTAPTLAGRPTRITDGDTFRFGETRVRLHGVDAPEMSTPQGAPAKRHLAGLIGSGPVRCRDTGQRSYDRVVAVCHGPDGRDLAAGMVEAGWALDAPRFSGGRYAASERSARAAGRGVFGN